MRPWHDQGGTPPWPLRLNCQLCMSRHPFQVFSVPIPPNFWRSAFRELFTSLPCISAFCGILTTVRCGEVHLVDYSPQSTVHKWILEKCILQISHHSPLQRSTFRELVTTVHSADVHSGECIWWISHHSPPCISAPWRRALISWFSHQSPPCISAPRIREFRGLVTTAHLA